VILDVDVACQLCCSCPGLVRERLVLDLATDSLLVGYSRFRPEFIFESGAIQSSAIYLSAQVRSQSLLGVKQCDHHQAILGNTVSAPLPGRI
jgi:hypothetical protein